MHEFFPIFYFLFEFMRNSFFSFFSFFFFIFHEKFFLKNQTWLDSMKQSLIQVLLTISSRISFLSNLKIEDIWFSDIFTEDKRYDWPDTG